MKKVLVSSLVAFSVLNYSSVSFAARSCRLQSAGVSTVAFKTAATTLPKDPAMSSDIYITNFQADSSGSNSAVIANGFGKMYRINTDGKPLQLEPLFHLGLSYYDRDSYRDISISSQGLGVSREWVYVPASKTVFRMRDLNPNIISAHQGTRGLIVAGVKSTTLSISIPSGKLDWYAEIKHEDIESLMTVKTFDLYNQFSGSITGVKWDSAGDNLIISNEYGVAVAPRKALLENKSLSNELAILNDNHQNLVAGSSAQYVLNGDTLVAATTKGFTVGKVDIAKKSIEVKTSQAYDRPATKNTSHEAQKITISPDGSTIYIFLNVLDERRTMVSGLVLSIDSKTGTTQNETVISGLTSNSLSLFEAQADGTVAIGSNNQFLLLK